MPPACTADPSAASVDVMSGSAAGGTLTPQAQPDRLGIGSTRKLGEPTDLGGGFRAAVVKTPRDVFGRRNEGAGSIAGS